ncbi:MAG: hypothetical protein ACPG7F_12535, partial [Aggregatilineales bacterium]
HRKGFLAMQLYCRQCGAEIKAENVNLGKMIAKCDTCNAVFSFADMYDDIEPKAKKSKRELYADVAMPNNMTLVENEKEMRIERKWFGCSTAMLLFFAIIWNGMIFGIFLPAVGLSGADDFPILFLVPFMAVGIGMGYMGIAGLVNSTTVYVNDHEISIKHAPLPIPGGNKYLDAANIEQLFTKMHVSHSDNGTNYTYSLNVIKTDGTRQKIIGSLDKAEQALYMEQEIERFSGIENLPVKGEYGQYAY